MKRSRTAAVLISIGAAAFALYSLEAILTFADPTWVDKLGTTLRRGPSVIDETMRIRGSHFPSFPFLQPDTYIDAYSRTKLSIDSVPVLPLSGIGSALTILCNESGTTIGYRSDSLGFRNPPDAWEPIHPEVALIGDSFAHGFCRPENETVAARMRAAGIRVVNAGLTGMGPLAELGVVREFLTSVKPKDVYWLFYEGNDLIDITSERQTHLTNYLKPAFSQHLLEKRHAIDSAIARFANSMLAEHRLPTRSQKIWSFLILRNLRRATGVYRQPPPQIINEREESLVLEDVLDLASTEIKGWGGTLHLVYLPERRRFVRYTPPVTGENHDPVAVEERVSRIAMRLGIPMIDVPAIFAAQANPARLWNARRYHYNADGYALVAEAIIADLKKQH